MDRFAAVVDLDAAGATVVRFGLELNQRRLQDVVQALGRSAATASTVPRTRGPGCCAASQRVGLLRPGHATVRLSHRDRFDLRLLLLVLFTLSEAAAAPRATRCASALVDT